MKKRILSLLLCMMLCLSVLPTMVFAEPSRTIDKLEITMPDLVAGAKDWDPIQLVTVPAGAAYVYEGGTEFIDSQGNELWGQTAFVAGEEYIAIISVRAADGYDFSFSESPEHPGHYDYTGQVTVHGGTFVAAELGEGDCIVQFKVTCNEKVEPASGLYIVYANTLNVRDDVNGNRIGGLKYGDVVQVTGKSGSWLRIDFNGGTGWVSSDYVARTYSAETAVDPAYYIVDVNAVNVRNDISTNEDNRIGGYTRGGKVLVTGTRTNAAGEVWLVVDYDGKLGFVKADLLYPEGEQPRTESAKANKSMRSLSLKLPENIDPKANGLTVIANAEEATVTNEAITAGENGSISFTIFPSDGTNFIAIDQESLNLPADFAYVIDTVEKNADGSVRVRMIARNTSEHTVTFKTNGHGGSVADQKVKHGEKVNDPDLSENGWTLEGWYADSTFSVPFSFTDAITADTTLYAKWTENTSAPSTGTIAISKSFFGLDAGVTIPTCTTFTVTDSTGTFNQSYTIGANFNKSDRGQYICNINVPAGTYTITESNNSVAGCTASVSYSGLRVTQNGIVATVVVAAGETSGVIVTNSYTPDTDPNPTRPTTPTTPSTPTQPKLDASPKTGDARQTALWTGMLALAFGTAAAALYIGRKKYQA